MYARFLFFFFAGRQGFDPLSIGNSLGHETYSAQRSTWDSRLFNNPRGMAKRYWHVFSIDNYAGRNLFFSVLQLEMASEEESTIG
jgi:hypothetical protein